MDCCLSLQYLFYVLVYAAVCADTDCGMRLLVLAAWTAALAVLFAATGCCMGLCLLLHGLQLHELTSRYICWYLLLLLVLVLVALPYGYVLAAGQLYGLAPSAARVGI